MMSKCELCEEYEKCGDKNKINCPFFKLEKEKSGSDKYHHASRSVSNQPNHIHFFQTQITQNPKNNG